MPTPATLGRYLSRVAQMTAGYVHQAEKRVWKGRCGQKRLLAVVFCPLRREGQTAGWAAAVPVRTSLLLTPTKSICLELGKSMFCAVLLPPKWEHSILIFSNMLLKSKMILMERLLFPDFTRSFRWSLAGAILWILNLNVILPGLVCRAACGSALSALSKMFPSLQNKQYNKHYDIWMP